MGRALRLLAMPPPRYSLPVYRNEVSVIQRAILIKKVTLMLFNLHGPENVRPYDIAHGMPIPTLPLTVTTVCGSWENLRSQVCEMPEANHYTRWVYQQMVEAGRWPTAFGSTEETL